MNTLKSFINKHRLSMSTVWADSNPHMNGDDNWVRSATHWKCLLKCRGRQMTVYFSQGAAHSGEPSIEDVLDCIASDSASVRNARSFEDWCGDFGYDTDSRKAEKTYKICETQADKLESLLNDSTAFESLLYNTERL